MKVLYVVFERRHNEFMNMSASSIQNNSISGTKPNGLTYKYSAVQALSVTVIVLESKKVSL